MTIPSVLNSSAELAVDRKTTHDTKVPEHQVVSGPQTLPNIDIIDIRHDSVLINLKEEILDSLRPSKGSKSLPTLLLYDERGLQLFEEVRQMRIPKKCELN